MTSQEDFNLPEPAQRGLRVPLPSSYAAYVNRWAIIVGISQYKYTSLNLNYADRDAEALYDHLLSPSGGGFETDHVVKLINTKATTANITRALRSFLKKPAREDLVLIYFACHGSPDFDRPENVYLLTHDADPNDISGTALPMREIELSLRENLLAEKVILLADACHSAAIAGGMGRRSVSDQTTVVNRYLKEVSLSRGGIALLTSAEANEVSFEDARWDGHGVFTYYLLKGMQGAADTNQNGFVTVGELFEYVREQVQRATEHRQHPCIGANPFDRELPLAIAFPTLNQQNVNPVTPPTTYPDEQRSEGSQRSGLPQTNSTPVNSTRIIAISGIVALLTSLVVITISNFSPVSVDSSHPSSDPMSSSQNPLLHAKEIAETGDLGQAIEVAKTANGDEAVEAQPLILQWEKQWQKEQAFFKQLETAYKAGKFDEVAPIALDETKIPHNAYWNQQMQKMLKTFQVAKDKERAGFQALLDEKLADARADFGEAYAQYPEYHNVDEIYHLVLTDAQVKEFNQGNEAEKQKILDDVYHTIIQKYSWGVPKDLLSQIKARLKS